MGENSKGDMREMRGQALGECAGGGGGRRLGGYVGCRGWMLQIFTLSTHPYAGVAGRII